MADISNKDAFNSLGQIPRHQIKRKEKKKKKTKQ